MAGVPSKVRVCIIGAGVAGLGAAQRLIEYGIDDLVVLEAQDRIGGRVHTVDHGEYHLEMGAQWIHGEEGNVVFQWASENSLVDQEMSLLQTGAGNTVFVRQDGETVEEEVQNAFIMTSANISESLENDCDKFSGSIGQYYTEKFKTENKWGTLGEELLDWKGRFTNCVEGSDSWYDLSAKGHTHFQECPGNPVVNWKENGYQNLLHHLKEKLASSRLFLNSPVKSINWGGGVSKASASGCKVMLTSDKVIHANHVIFTPSLSVLKALAKDMFTPSLPLQKLKAIEGLGIGVVNKIFLQFAHRWWDDNCDGFSFLYNLQQVPVTITKENWEYGLLGVYEVFKHPDMLCGWITGPAALVMEQISEEEVAQRCVAQLRRLLSNKFQIPDAVFCKRSSWGSNPWIRGAYSFRSMKTEAMGVKAADLAQPLLDSNNVPLVCFAGEATHNCYYGTVHGALETGWREADTLIKHLKSVPAYVSVQPSLVRKRYNVIIVGAGAAGIGAARELKAQNINSILILEGNGRIGGRVKTIETAPQCVVELGAQWIHGEDGNAVYQFASPRNLIHHKLSVDGRGDFYAENGRLIDEHLVTEVLEEMEAADDTCKTYNHNRQLKELAHLSVGEVFHTKFFKYLASCKNDGALSWKLKMAVYYWCLRWYRIDNACDSLHQLSASCWGNYVYCPGKDNMNPKHGFLSILAAIFAETRADLQLNSEVVCIDYANEVIRERGVYVRPDGTTYPVIVKCKDGDEYEAQHVIVTSSVGYLKKNTNLFSPALPKVLQQMSKYWIRAISGFDPVFKQKAMLCGWIGGAEAVYMEGLSEHQVAQACTKLLRHFLNINVPYPKKIYRSQWARDNFFHGSYSYHGVGCECNSEELENDLNTPVCAVSNDGNKVPVLVLAGEANSRAHYSTVHGALQNGIEQTGHYVNSHRRLHGGHIKIQSKI
ncbi:uncharacterized protein [Cherax quadricarinatus]|uniref:uncharacterized protein isoform X2 n=1 Tax=Cherax quadricarinatus TaxID=27406 RepID=UPI00387E2210